MVKTKPPMIRRGVTPNIFGSGNPRKETKLSRRPQKGKCPLVSWSVFALLDKRTNPAVPGKLQTPVQQAGPWELSSGTDGWTAKMTQHLGEPSAQLARGEGSQLFLSFFLSRKRIASFLTTFTWHVPAARSPRAVLCHAKGKAIAAGG